MAPIPTDDVTPDDQRRAGEALRASFARLAPQGSDEWHFIGQRSHSWATGALRAPYQPGASTSGARGRAADREEAGRLVDVWAASGRDAPRRRRPPDPRPRSPSSTRP